MPVSDRLMGEIAQRYPWMNQQMLDAYQSSWSEFESGDLALDAVRQTDSYRTTFAGNIDDNGMARMTEQEYFASKARFDATLTSVGVNPSYFQDEWVAALEGEVSPNEMEGRIEAAYERIVQSAPEIRNFYAENYGIDLTDAAIIASALSPRIGEEILSRRIAVAEIGASAIQRGFDIEGMFADQLAQYGMDQRGANQMFSWAESVIPGMQALMERHGDPDDEFDLQDVTSAFLFDDPETRRKIRRYTAMEQSMFTGGAATDIVRDQRQGMGVTGLSTR